MTLSTRIVLTPQKETLSFSRLSLSLSPKNESTVCWSRFVDEMGRLVSSCFGSNRNRSLPSFFRGRRIGEEDSLHLLCSLSVVASTIPDDVEREAALFSSHPPLQPVVTLFIINIPHDRRRVTVCVTFRCTEDTGNPGSRPAEEKRSH